MENISLESLYSKISWRLDKIKQEKKSLNKKIKELETNNHNLKEQNSILNKQLEELKENNIKNISLLNNDNLKTVKTEFLELQKECSKLKDINVNLEKKIQKENNDKIIINNNLQNIENRMNNILKKITKFFANNS